MQAEGEHDTLLRHEPSMVYSVQSPSPHRGEHNISAASTTAACQSKLLTNCNPSLSATPSLHYDQQYINLRKSYSYWHEQTPTSTFASEAQNALWEAAARSGTLASASPCNFPHLVELATTYNPSGFTAVHLAAIKSNLTLLRQIAQACDKAALNTPSELALNGSPLHWAAAAGNIDACATLLELGAEVDSRDVYGTTPLMVACVHQHVLVVCLLILRGAKLDKGDECNATALAWAAHADCRDACSVLVHAGAAVDACDTYGQTPLHASISRPSLKSAQFLMWVGARPDQADIAGWTPRLMAKWRRLHSKKQGAKHDSTIYRLEILMWTVGTGNTTSDVTLDTSPRARYIPGRSTLGSKAVLANKVFGYFVYVTRVVPLLHTGAVSGFLLWLQAVQVPLHIAMWYFYQKTRDSSGELGCDTLEYRSVIEKLGDSSEPSAMLAWKDFCHICQTVRPQNTKTKHCSICMRCVPGQDHHCTLMDRCVGHANRLYFVGYTGSVALVCTVFCILLRAASSRLSSMLLSVTFWDYVFCTGLNLVLVITQLKLRLFPKPIKAFDEALRI